MLVSRETQRVKKMCLLLRGEEKKRVILARWLVGWLAALFVGGERVAVKLPSGALVSTNNDSDAPTNMSVAHQPSNTA